MYDRIFAGTLLALSGLIVWAALQLEVPFQYEPLGPKAFPVILGSLLAISALWLIYKPSENDWFPNKEVIIKLLVALGLMAGYAFMFEPVGFVGATFIVGAIFSWLFGETPLKAAIFALVMSVVSYFLLTTLLQLNVPLGHLFGG